MSIDKLRDLVHATPFQPFTIHMADGRSVEMPHPDFIAITVDNRTAIVTASKRGQRPSFNIIAIPLVTQLEVHGVPVDTE